MSTFPAHGYRRPSPGTWRTRSTGGAALMPTVRRWIAELTPAEQSNVARLLTRTRPPKSVSRYRRTFLAITAGGSVFMVGWVVLLGITLPAESTAHSWRLAWVGFDVAEFLALTVTGFAAWRARSLLVPATIVTGTLLLSDAWFDIVLSLGSPGMAGSIASAFLEIPLAGLFWWTAGKLIQRQVSFERAALGLEGQPPHLYRVALFTPLAIDELATLAELSPGADGVASRLHSAAAHPWADSVPSHPRRAGTTLLRIRPPKWK